MCPLQLNETRVFFWLRTTPAACQECQLAELGDPVVVLATAHACKFEAALRTALGDEFWQANMSPQAVSCMMPERAAALYSQPEVHTGVLKAEDRDRWRELLQANIEAQCASGYVP